MLQSSEEALADWLWHRALSVTRLLLRAGVLVPNPERDALFTFESTGAQMNTQSLRRRLVGGAGALWSGRCAPLDPVDFVAKPWAKHVGWPVSYGDLEPYYDAALSLLGLPLVKVAVQQNAATRLKDQHFGEGLEPQLWQFARTRAKRPLHLGQHFISTFRSENKFLLTEADAVELECDGSRVVAVRCKDRSRRVVTVRANQFILACGCIEASRFLLQNCLRWPDLFGPVSPWLGKGFHQHLLFDAGPILTDRKGAIQLQRILNVFGKHAHQSFETGVRLTEEFILKQEALAASAIVRYEPRPFWISLERANRALAQVTKKDPLYFNPNLRVELSVEQGIDRSNAISLSPQYDMNGQFGARVHWGMSELELRTAANLTQLFSQALSSSQLGRFQPLLRPEDVLACPMRDSLHHMGGTQMSETCSTGVVDRNLRVHTTENLFVVGGSVFPSGGHVNPTLTIAALALKLAERLNRP